MVYARSTPFRKLLCKVSILSYVREEELREIREEEQRYKNGQPSMIDPMSVSLNCLPARLAQCAELQRHTCGEHCLIRKWSLLQCKKKGWDPLKTKIKDLKKEQIKELLKCKKNFPKTVPAEFGQLKAHVTIDYTKIVRYHGPRDDEYINACHPMISHIWSANTDLQILHGEGKRRFTVIE